MRSQKIEGGDERVKKKNKKEKATSGRKQPIPLKIRPGMLVVLNSR